ncbi:YlxR family protein [Rhodococcus sp. D2-41]|nr:YlxR family protein [Rhodococcus sp. D2-41]
MVQREDSAPVPVAAETPVRTCIGCRSRAQATELLRIVAREAGPGAFLLVPDPRRRLTGRGAWLHPTPECLVQAERRRAFGRALRVSGQPGTEAVADWIAADSTTS